MWLHARRPPATIFSFATLISQLQVRVLDSACLICAQYVIEPTLAHKCIDEYMCGCHRHHCLSPASCVQVRAGDAVSALLSYSIGTC